MSNVIAAIGTIGLAAATGGASLAVTGAVATATTLSTIFSVGSALAAIGQGISANNRAKTEAAFARTEAEQELQKGAEQSRDLAREHAALRSEQDVIQLANGVDIGVGTPVNVARATNIIAQRNLSKTRENARNRFRSARLRSRGLLSEGRASLLGGFGKAAGIGIDAAQLTG